MAPGTCTTPTFPFPYALSAFHGPCALPCHVFSSHLPHSHQLVSEDAKDPNYRSYLSDHRARRSAIISSLLSSGGIAINAYIGPQLSRETYVPTKRHDPALTFTTLYLSAYRNIQYPIHLPIYLRHSLLLLLPKVDPSTTTVMTVTLEPQWLQTTQRKRQIRDDAIQRWSKEHDDSSTQPTSKPTHLDSVQEIVQAISSKSVSATELCNAYIRR